MEQSSLNPEATQVVAVSRCDRWQVYQRLQALGIPCCCTENGCLRAEVNSPLAALQVWSVLRQLTASRQELAAVLNQCWQLKR